MAFIACGRSQPVGGRAERLPLPPGGPAPSRCVESRSGSYGANPSSRNRQGFTLLELLLVLVLLAIMAAAAWPSIDKGLQTQALKSAADQLRSAWVRARVAAMTEGQVHLFWFEQGSGRYIVQAQAAPIEELNHAGGGGGTAGFGAGGGGAGHGAGNAAQGKTLPEGIIFHVGRMEQDLRAETLSFASAPPAEGAWGQPVFFYPDGTTSTVSVALGNPQGRFILVALRGLTGSTRHSELLTAEQLP